MYVTIIFTKYCIQLYYIIIIVGIKKGLKKRKKENFAKKKYINNIIIGTCLYVFSTTIFFILSSMIIKYSWLYGVIHLSILRKILSISENTIFFFEIFLLHNFKLL